MEENTKFVNETDYKSLWEYVNKKCNEAEALASKRLDQIEDQEKELAEARRALEDSEDYAKRLEARIDNLIGQVDAYKYAIRCFGAGDAK
jgi:septal ring factor EnvC (AmiA/AmiB activator)